MPLFPPVDQKFDSQKNQKKNQDSNDRTSGRDQIVDDGKHRIQKSENESGKQKPSHKGRQIQEFPACSDPVFFHNDQEHQEKTPNRSRHKQNMICRFPGIT